MADDKEILKRLDTIVFLLLELKDKEGKMPLKEKIRLLNDAGLDYTQIAKVLGKNAGNIAVQLTLMKKDSQKKIKPKAKPKDITEESLVEQEVKNNEG
ncbi:MAG: hypothetical protein ABIH59_00855 [archaeon]